MLQVLITLPRTPWLRRKFQSGQRFYLSRLYSRQQNQWNKEAITFLNSWNHFLIGSDCKMERVGITIQEITYKPPLSNQVSIEFKNLESKLLSAVSLISCIKHRHQIYTYTPWRKSCDCILLEIIVLAMPIRLQMVLIFLLFMKTIFYLEFWSPLLLILLNNGVEKFLKRRSFLSFIFLIN